MENKSALIVTSVNTYDYKTPMNKRIISGRFTKEMVNSKKPGPYIAFKDLLESEGYKVISETEYIDYTENSEGTEMVLVQIENEDMYALGQIPDEEKEELLKCATDEELEDLGYHYYGQLMTVEGYESFFERLHVAYKINEDSREVYTVVFFDAGNTYISIDSTNIYIPELIKSLNENAKPKEKKNTTDTIDYDSIESLDRF